MIILLTGSGFLAKEIQEKLDVIKVPRSVLENPKKLLTMVEEAGAEFIIHTSWADVGGGGSGSYEWNMLVHDNLLQISSLVKSIFIFGSGCETEPVHEDRFWYKKGKVDVAAKVITNNKFINLILYGCFGRHEEPTRLIKNCMNRISNNLPIELKQDRWMDFLYVDDLISIIKYYMNNPIDLPRRLDCVYPHNHELNHLSSICKFLCEKYGGVYLKNPTTEGYNDDYVGDPTALSRLNIALKGIKKGIEEIYG